MRFWRFTFDKKVGWVLQLRNVYGWIRPFFSTYLSSSLTCFIFSWLELHRSQPDDDKCATKADRQTRHTDERTKKGKAGSWDDEERRNLNWFSRESCGEVDHVEIYIDGRRDVLFLFFARSGRIFYDVFGIVETFPFLHFWSSYHAFFLILGWCSSFQDSTVACVEGKDYLPLRIPFSSRMLFLFFFVYLRSSVFLLKCRFP